MTQESRLLVRPQMRPIDRLARLDASAGFLGLIVGEADGAGEIHRVIRLEVEKGIGREVVLDAAGIRGYHRFPEGEVLENAGREIAFGEGGASVGNDAEVRLGNRLDRKSVV